MSRAIDPVANSPIVSGAIPDDAVYRLSVEQYHGMISAGVLAEDEAVELLEGWLVPKMTKNPRHRVATGLVRRALERAVPAGWFVDSQEPVTTADSEPEPDVSVIRGELRQYLSNHPGSRDTALVVEVADASLARDRTTKQRVYARAGVPVYWIVNLVDRRVEVHTEPSGPTDRPGYRARREFGPEDEVPLFLDGREVARLRVCDLLP
jgi:Uma2 family endonuclease